jgi:DNA-binding IclR family transcriptional regulator
VTVYGRGKQIVIAKEDMPSAMGFSVRVGAELDLLVSASGRVLLAFQDERAQVMRIKEARSRSQQ